jgi:hypothetical protein
MPKGRQALVADAQATGVRATPAITSRVKEQLDKLPLLASARWVIEPVRRTGRMDINDEP